MLNIEKFITDLGYYNIWKSPHKNDDRYRFHFDSPYGKTVLEAEAIFNSNEYKIELAGASRKFTRKDGKRKDIYVTRLSDGVRISSKIKKYKLDTNATTQDVINQLFVCMEYMAKS